MKKFNQKLFSIFFICFVLFGCSSYFEERKLITNNLKDPESTKFRNEKKYSNGYVCGEFNSKNSYGAYTGYVRYVAKKHSDSQALSSKEYYSEDGIFSIGNSDKFKLFLGDKENNYKNAFEKTWGEYCK